MDTNNTATQFRAGLFMLLGLICIASLVLYFGRFSATVKNFYTITVEYRNASGLLKGADVLLAGARIGEISDSPYILGDMKGVAVPLKIDDRVKIPQGSVFSIGSSGLLGDRYVTVTMSEDAAGRKPIPPNSVITNGISESSIAELQRQIHDEILPKLDSALGNIDGVSKTLRDEIFNEQGVKNFQVTLANLRTASDALAASSGEIRNITSQATVFLKKGNDTMDTARGVADDLKAFITNLRQHGIIFYRDTAPVGAPRK